MARAFRTAAEQESSDHFTAEVELIGFVGSNAANPGDSIAGEGYEATTMYPTFGRLAAALDDKKAAELFREIARDEAGHLRTFAGALRSLLS